MKLLIVIAIASFVLVLNSACTSKPLTPEERFAKMSAVEHLDLAKSNIENHYYDSAKKHLDAITSDKPEFARAQELTRELANEEKTYLQKEAEKKVLLPVWFDLTDAYDNASKDAKRHGLSPAKEEYLQDKYKAQVAKRYKLTSKQMDKIMARGVRENWPMPEEARSTRVPKSDYEREKENAEFGANMYKAAQILKNR